MRGARTAVVVALAGVLAGCQPGDVTATMTSAPPPPALGLAAPTGDAASALAALQVKGRAPMTGYDRAQFGQAWADVDRNGCDTRNDVLRLDLTQITVKPGTRGCVIATGVLADPYSGTTITFARGAATSSAVQVDHVVALGDAWATGARQLDADRRRDLANDPLNLLAVDGPLNSAKGSGDAATWLPPAAGARCEYAARQVAVKTTYGLWVKPAERDALAAVLATCPGQGLPGPGQRPTPPTAQPTTAPPPPAAGPFPNCAAARAAGAAPVRAGDPGYSTRLDRDGDGTACE